jgi:hypothetical protein
MSGVNWQNRFGANCITSVRWQMCGSCWAHAATALIESTVRIEHSLWLARSEGDIRVGTGKRCKDGGNVTFALDWVRANGICDPDCFPDTPANMPHVTTADRDGRTVRLPTVYTEIHNIQDQKRWLDTVGPLTTRFTVWEDFFALGNGVYRRLATISVGGQPNFGIVWDGRPFWIGDFNGNNRADVLFYYLGDENWWLGSYQGTGFAWTWGGNTSGFGQVWDGRPFWIGRFSRADRDEVLFYYPGDDNWWLGSHNGNQLIWSFAGNTANFGHGINDGRPFWVGDFNGDGRSDVLFYYPGDGNWWLGSYQAGTFSWSLVSNTGTPNAIVAGHYMLVVGYNDPDPNDPDGYWIVKNSWGTNWGTGGFGRIAYGECDIDSFAKIGLRDTNPDPWAKRRLHAGNLLESGNGSMRRNFEMIATHDGGPVLRHWWRDNSSPGLPWYPAETFGNDALACPTFTASTYNRNFECIYLSTNGRLHHWYFDQSSQQWKDGGVFGPVDAAGVPGFIQTSRNAPGDFEVVVRTSDGRLSHWIRRNGAPWSSLPGTWREVARFGTNVLASGPSLVQSRMVSKGATGQPYGDLHLVCVANYGRLEHWSLIAGGVWTRLVSFGTRIVSPPCMIETQWGMTDETGVGNFELCVAVGGAVQHWWRDNSGNKAWSQSATFGHDVQAVVGLLQASFGFNLEVVVLTTERMLQHYWRDSAGWHEGVVIGHA